MKKSSSGARNAARPSTDATATRTAISWHGPDPCPKSVGLRSSTLLRNTSKRAHFLQRAPAGGCKYKREFEPVVVPEPNAAESNVAEHREADAHRLVAVGLKSSRPNQYYDTICRGIHVNLNFILEK